jgi:hypothetical protein
MNVEIQEIGIERMPSLIGIEFKMGDDCRFEKYAFSSRAAKVLNSSKVVSQA